jgi:F-type H+-transporting ATPase subunit beta
VDELSKADQTAVARARRLERFFSQPFTVTKQFTGLDGKSVSAADTVKSCGEICEGMWDHLPEQAFMYVGKVAEAKEKASGG